MLTLSLGLVAHAHDFVSYAGKTNPQVKISSIACKVEVQSRDGRKILDYDNKGDEEEEWKDWEIEENKLGTIGRGKIRKK